MIDYIFGEEAAAALRRERMIDEGRALVARDAAADVAHSEYLALIGTANAKRAKRCATPPLRPSKLALCCLKPTRSDHGRAGGVH